MLFTKSQYKGVLTLLILALIGWMIYALWPEQQVDLSSLPEVEGPKKYRSWEERKDSMRRADSIRYAEWAAERELRYDSFRVADSLRRAEWRVQRQAQFDSARIVDSLWRDSMGIYYVKKEKRDTILDLNHCDTTELMLIRGIGRYTAIRIVQYREQLGGYYSISQLTDDPFHKCHLDTLLHHFIIDTSAIQKIPVNTSSIEKLQRHPYIRYDQANAIYSHRRKKIKLSSIHDLHSLPELTEEDLHRIAPYLSFEH